MELKKKPIPDDPMQLKKGRLDSEGPLPKRRIKGNSYDKD
jgi:hypothetical protein